MDNQLAIQEGNSLVKQSEKNKEVPIIIDNDKFIELFNEVNKGKQKITDISSFSKEKIKKFLGNNIKYIIVNDKLDCFSIDIIAQVCCDGFPKKYIKTSFFSRIKDWGIEKFNEKIAGDSVFEIKELSEEHINKCINYLEDNIECGQKSNYVNNLCNKLLSNTVSLSDDIFKKCMSIKIKNMHDKNFSDFYLIANEIQDFKKLTEIPICFVPDNIKKMFDKSINRLKDKNILTNWRETYFNYFAECLVDFSEKIPQNFNFKNQLSYIKEIIDIINESAISKTFLENFILNIHKKVIINADSEVSFLKEFEEFFDICMKCISKETIQKTLIENLIKYENMKKNSKIDILKKYFTENGYSEEIKILIAEYFITSIENENPSTEIYNSLLSYIEQTGNEEIFNNLLQNVSLDNKIKIIKNITNNLCSNEDLSKNLLSLKNLIEKIFNDSEQRFDDSLKTRLIDKLFVLDKDKENNREVESIISKIVVSKTPDFVKNELRKKIKDYDDKKINSFIKQVYHNNSNSFKGMVNFFEVNELLDFILSYDDNEFCNYIVNLTESVESENVIIENFGKKIIECDDNKIREKIRINYFEKLTEEKKINFVNKLYIVNDKSFDELPSCYKDYETKVLCNPDEIINNLKNYFNEIIKKKDNNSIKSFISLFFNEKLNDDHKREVINFIFDNLK